MKLKRIEVTICEACLNGERGVCHTPGCALCRHAVDLPIDPLEYIVLEEWEDEEPEITRKKILAKEAGGEGWNVAVSSILV